MFRFFSRFRRQPLPPNVARIRIIPKRNLDRAVFGLAIGISVLTSVPQDISRRLDKPIYIPLGFARETQASRENQLAFTEEDLATQKKVFEDIELRNKIKTTVAQRLVAAQNAPPSVAFQKQCRFRFTWLFIKYPSRPPPEYERFCLRITGDSTVLETQPVSSTNVHRMRVIFNPLTVYQAARRAFDATFPALPTTPTGVTTPYIPSEPAGLRFLANLIAEMRKAWKPPSFIPRNHVVVQGLVELVGNGQLAVVEVDMSINPTNLNDLVWRSAVVKYSGKFDPSKEKVKPGQLPTNDWTHALVLANKAITEKRAKAAKHKAAEARWVELEQQQQQEKERAALAMEEEKEKERKAERKKEEEETGMVEVSPDGPKLYVPEPLHSEEHQEGDKDVTTTENHHMPVEEQKKTDKKTELYPDVTDPNQGTKEPNRTKESIEDSEGPRSPEVPEGKKEEEGKHSVDDGRAD
ncbi:hypothetical protein BJ508DRAFT_357818 [Ascobolus immersus RN42]|uniref:Uncharacterized protein n=1 Tax=Ascobolus immersus RN42 TaxID=1160509 RepID=A0A3N4IMR6_ASCIM|nr:hypothetical protein BJ508DRAFT_357818 [Ascobolus immersus RN42]